MTIRILIIKIIVITWLKPYKFNNLLLKKIFLVVHKILVKIYFKKKFF